MERYVLHLCAGGCALHLDLDLLGQAGIVLAEQNENLFATEVVDNRGAVGQSLAQLGAGQDDAVVLGVRAGAFCA